jgi:hypothetical protein
MSETKCPNCDKPWITREKDFPRVHECHARCKYINDKEHIAAIIFDFDEDEEYVRPSEETCHKIAEEILTRVLDY